MKFLNLIILKFPIFQLRSLIKKSTETSKIILERNLKIYYLFNVKEQTMIHMMELYFIHFICLQECNGNFSNNSREKITERYLFKLI